MPRKSSPSPPTISPMNPCHHHHPPGAAAVAVAAGEDDASEDHLRLLHHSLLMVDDDDQTLATHPDHDHRRRRHHHNHHHHSFSSLLRDPDDDDDEDEPADDDDHDVEIDPEDALIDNPAAPEPPPNPAPARVGISDACAVPARSSAAAASAAAADAAPRIDPTPHISTQFYTFNRESHALMVQCVLEGRFATVDEIRAAIPRSVLKSWRAVWKDRNEDTAYITAWKRLQDKLQASRLEDGTPALFFKTNSAQRISHVDQWQEIVAAAHSDPDLLQHLGLKETIERIKQSWTVGAKLYGIPESFIRVCVASCPVCSNFSFSSPSSGGAVGSSLAARSKRRRFEYTESLEVPARDVQRRLQQLAAKHKVVLCIRQKYIRYKPFMAEVKDYACHRAGAPSSASASGKKAKVLKREHYQSKRCGCGFRIRAIVPITNYNDKDKTFVYNEEGTAVFKLYAVHSGHEPGPLDGSARIIHRMVGNKGFFEFDPEVYGVMEEIEPELFDRGDDSRTMVLQQTREIINEVTSLEGKITKMSFEMLGSLSHELSGILDRLRNLGAGLRYSGEALLVGEAEVAQWGNEGQMESHDRLFRKDAEMIEDDDTDFGSSLGPIAPWDGIEGECSDRKLLLRESLKSDKWMMKEDCGDFDEKSILNCSEVDEDSKLIKPMTDPNLVGIHVDGFYSDNKWYDSPNGLGTGTDSGDGSFHHGDIV